MKDKDLRRLLHAADPETIAEFPASSEPTKEHILRRTLAKSQTEPVEMTESETFTVTEAKRSRMPALLIGIAACMAGVVCIGGIVSLQRAKPPTLQPYGQTEIAAAKSMTPFGDIVAAKPWFTVPMTDDAQWATDEQTAALREKIYQDGGYMAQEYSLSPASLASLAEVFRQYGWMPVREDLLTEEQKADPSSDFIIMHLASDPEHHGGEYLTACFNFGAGIIRVETAGETTYYEMDHGELQRCMDVIVRQQGETEYAPLQMDWSGMTVYEEDAGNGTYRQLSAGQLNTFERMLKATDWYPWSVYYQSNPDNGGYVYQFRVTDANGANMTFSFYPDSQLMDVYQREPQEMTSRLVAQLRPSDPEFFAEVNGLVLGHRYPFAPTTMEAEFSVTVSGRTTPLSREMNRLIAEQFSRMKWIHTDDEPQESCTLTLDCEDYYGDSTFLFSPDTQVIEWKQGETVLERFVLSPDDMRAIEKILDGEPVGQPFMSLPLSSQMTYFRCVEVEANGKAFGVQLPESGKTFSADIFEVQKLLDTLSWEPVELPVENWKPGYIEMYCGGGRMLFSATPYSSDVQQYLLRWDGTNGTVYQYLADHAFMEQFMQLLADSAEENYVSLPDEQNEAEEAEKIARLYVQSYYPDRYTAIQRTEVKAVKELPLQYGGIVDGIPADLPLYEVSIFTDGSDTTEDQIYVAGHEVIAYSVHFIEHWESITFSKDEVTDAAQRFFAEQGSGSTEPVTWTEVKEVYSLPESNSITGPYFRVRYFICSGDTVKRAEIMVVRQNGQFTGHSCYEDTLEPLEGVMKAAAFRQLRKDHPQAAGCITDSSLYRLDETQNASPLMNPYEGADTSGTAYAVGFTTSGYGWFTYYIAQHDNGSIEIFGDLHKQT